MVECDDAANENSAEQRDTKGNESGEYSDSNRTPDSIPKTLTGDLKPPWT
jgi:hypothetical protein